MMELKIKDLNSKEKLIIYIEDLLSKKRNMKPNKHYACKPMPYKIEEEIIDKIIEEKFNNKTWSKLKSKEKKEVVKTAIRKALSICLDINFIKDKTYQSEKLHHSEEFETEKCVIYLQYLKKVGVHPSPEDFRPSLKKIGFDKKRNKKIYIIEVADEGEYKSFKHHNVLKIIGFDELITENSIYFFIKYELWREALDFGKYKKFAFIFGVDDGSFFVDRVSPNNVNNVEEAIEWLKPAEVRRAEEEGRLTLRQGDVFFVELKSRKRTIFDYRNKIPHNHKIIKEGEKVIIKHHEHSQLILPHPHFKPVLRKTLNISRFD